MSTDSQYHTDQIEIILNNDLFALCKQYYLLCSNWLEQNMVESIPAPGSILASRC